MAKYICKFIDSDSSRKVLLDNYEIEFPESYSFSGILVVDGVWFKQTWSEEHKLVFRLVDEGLRVKLPSELSESFHTKLEK